ncbi:hypothetical protein [Streptomyces exfoliatus]|uniref:hypothetical protein n=1 Tax=Streptomyces exfoliatus TaxID=1905 RepID=UPI003C2C6E5A
MTGSAGQNQPDPSGVSSAAELAAAAKSLMKGLGVTGVELATRTNLATGTVSELINGKTFPREATFEVFVTDGCGQEWEPWRQAWSRAQRDVLSQRPVGELAIELEQLRERVEELEQVLQQTLQETRERRQADARQERELEQQQAAREAGAQFLAWVGAPQFRRITPAYPSKESAVSIQEVDEFLGRVHELACRSLEELQLYLWTHSGTFGEAGGFFSQGSWRPSPGYVEADVKGYRSRLLTAVMRHFGPRDAAAHSAWAERADASRHPLRNDAHLNDHV